MIVSPDSHPIRSPEHRWGKLGALFQKFFPSKRVNKFITQKCEQYKSPESRSRIASFAKENDISPDTIERCQDSPSADQCWDRFDSLNDFFIRRRAGLPSPDPARKDIVSPADAYTVYLTRSTIRHKLWIKGNSFHVQDLFPSSSLPKHFHLFVFRLAPHHYHRFHVPVNGVISDLYFTGSEHYSVHPWVVQSSVDVLTENVRCVVEITPFSSPESKIWMTCIGATCVASIQLRHQQGDVVTAMDELGHFEFGGSCIVLLCPTSYTHNATTRQLLKHSWNEWETDIRVGTPLLECNNKN